MLWFGAATGVVIALGLSHVVLFAYFYGWRRRRDPLMLHVWLMAGAHVAGLVALLLRWVSEAWLDYWPGALAAVWWINVYIFAWGTVFAQRGLMRYQRLLRPGRGSEEGWGC